MASTKWTQSISLKGSSLLTGNGAPSDALGQDGDTYLNLDTFDLYPAKTGGAWPTTFSNIRGPAGYTGSTGASIIAHAGLPVAEDGVDGDLFFSTDVGTLYGPKAGGAWPTEGISLIGAKGDKGDQGDLGPVGPAGSVINSGHGEPDDAVGVAGDYWLDLDTGRLYGPKSA